MHPLEFCDLAERLIQNEKNAAGFRTAISRSYYGAFHQARDFLERLSIFLVSSKPHVEVIAILTNSGDPDVDQAASLLGDLRDKRNVADYELRNPTIEVEVVAVKCLTDAREVIAKLNGCRISPTRIA